MNRRHVFFASLLIIGLALGLFLITKVVQPNPSSTFYSNVLLAAAAIGGAVAFLAGFKDTVELLQGLTSKSEAATKTGDSIQNTISGPVQVVFGGIHNTTINITYIVQDSSNQNNTFRSPQPSDLPHKQIINMAPPPLPDFVGRYAEVEAFKKILLQKPETIGVVSQIRGMGGIGKTTLVSKVANDPYIQKVFSDGILWTSLVDNANLSDTLYMWINALDPSVEVSRTDDNLILLDVFRTLVEGRKLLIVFDDVQKDIAPQIRSIINVVGKESKIIVTSRSLALAGVQTQTIISLDVLPEQEALRLLQTLMGRKLTQAELKIGSELVFLLGYHPLAIRLVGASLHRENASLKDYLNKLHKTVQDFQDLDTIREKQVTSIKRSMDYAFQRLSETDQNRFLLLGAISSEKLYTANSLADYWKVNYDQGMTTLTNLEQWGLLAKDGDNYRIHPLVQEYVMETNLKGRFTEEE